MLQSSRFLCVVTLSLSTACIVTPDAKPGFGASLQAASQFNHRGMPFNTEGVLQSNVAVDLPTKGGGFLVFKSFANVDLSNDANGWLPDGHGGKVSQADFILQYDHPLSDRFDLSVGYHTYLLPNGVEFPFGERGETKEVFATLVMNDLPVTPRIELRYDVDEVEDVYARLGLQKNFQLDEKSGLTADLTLGISGEDQSFWNYGVTESGLADLIASVTYDVDVAPNTTFFVQAAGSTIIDSDIKDWFDVLNSSRDGIDSENLWVVVGVNWNWGE